MRTSKSFLFLVICFVYLCCFVQQCHFFAFNMVANGMSNALAHAFTMTSAMALNIFQSTASNFISTVGHGLATIHTMTMALISGFFMGNLALAGFILFLLAVVPAEEERRSLGGNSVFTPILPYYYNHTNYHGVPLLPYHNVTDTRGIPIRVSPTNSSLVRIKRNLLVNSNATTANNSTTTVGIFTLPASLVKESNSTAERIPRFLTRLVQRDPFNCLPLLLCGLSASRKPSERTEVLNDYAYLLKEFLQNESSESPEYDGSDEDEKKKADKKERYRSTLNLINQLVQGGYQGKQKDEVDKLIDEKLREEDERLEELALTEMAEDPNDLRFALEDMKLRGLKKTISKVPKQTKKKYLSKLLGEESNEEEDELDLVPDEEDPDVPKALMGRYERPQYTEESTSMEDGYLRAGRYPVYYDPRDLTRGAFPPPPPTPPTPEYGVSEEEDLYNRNVAMLEKNLEHEIPGGFMGRNGGPMPGMGPPHLYPMRPPMNQGRRRSRRDVRHAAPQRAFLQKKRGEAAEADNIFDKSRVATEVGAVTRNNRQCRALFNECPVNTIARPVAQAAADTVGGAPFLNRAVNNIRRVLLGTSPGGESAKAKRVNEIKEAIQQLHPPARQAGSEVKVVLNIGPSPPPMDLHRSGGMPAANPYSPYQGAPAYNGMVSSMNYPQQNYMPPSQMPAPQSSKAPPSPSPTGFSSNIKYAIAKKPAVSPTNHPQATTAHPIPRTTLKTMVYRNPSSSLASKKPLPAVTTTITTTVPSLDLEDLEYVLKTTLPPMQSQEETIQPFVEHTTPAFGTFSDIVASMEQDEPSVEDDLVLPTKYPMSKEQYAQSLRETFNIFDRFKEAHKTPVIVTIGRTTVRPRTTPESSGTRKKTPQKIGVKGSPSKGNKHKPSGQKGEQADLEVDDVADGEKDDVLSGVFKWFDKLRNRDKKKGHKKKGKGKKGKGKNKKKEESSEESSEEEEDHLGHPALVAVPPPHRRQEIHWRGGTTLVKDGVYHLLFGKKATKPLPPHPLHYHSGSLAVKHHEHGKKPIRHDGHYFEPPHEEVHHHPPPKKTGGPEDALNGDFRPSFYDHRLRTSESVEDEIPPPPPPNQQDDTEQPQKDTPKPANSGSSSASESSSSSGTLIIATRKPPQQATLMEPRPIPRPDPEPSSYEDDNDNNENDYYRNHPPPLPPSKRFNPPQYDSRSIETSYEEDEEEEMDDNASGSGEEPVKPQLVFTPFSLVRNGNKMKLKSKGGVTNINGKAQSIGSSKKKKGSKASSNSGRSDKESGNTLMRRNNAANARRKGVSSKKSVKTTSKPGLMTKVKAMSTTTVKPKRKILKYKNG